MPEWPFLDADVRVLLLSYFEQQHGRPPTPAERCLVFDYANAMFRDVPRFVLEGRPPKAAVSLGSELAVREAMRKQPR